MQGSWLPAEPRSSCGHSDHFDVSEQHQHQAPDLGIRCTFSVSFADQEALVEDLGQDSPEHYQQLLLGQSKPAQPVQKKSTDTTVGRMAGGNHTKKNLAKQTKLQKAIQSV